LDINYKSYVVFPYTASFLKKKYTQDILDKWSDQLSFLFQNGFTLQDNSPTLIEEQMVLFNGFKSYEDFEDLKRTFGRAGDFDEPTIEGYKIVDSLLEFILTSSAGVGKHQFQDIKKAGTSLKNNIKKILDYLQFLFGSEDLEIERVMKLVKTEKASDLLNDCLDAFEDEHYAVMLVKFQALYEQIEEMHKKCYRALLNSSEKGLQTRMGNVNDEIYGSSGGYNPNDNSIVCKNGSLVYELKLLTDKTIPTKSLRVKMLVIAQEAVDNGDKDKLLLSFLSGDNSRIEAVRNILIQTDLSGCMVLLSLKHGLTLFDDSLNSERAKRIAHEFSAICKYVGIEGTDLA